MGVEAAPRRRVSRSIRARIPPAQSCTISGTNGRHSWHPEGELRSPPLRQLGVPGSQSPCHRPFGCPVPQEHGWPTVFPIDATRPFRINPSPPLPSSDAAGVLLAFAQLPIFLLPLPHPLPARPTPHHLSHPSEVNSSENFPWEQFPLLIMPAALAQLGAIWLPTAGKTSDTCLE